MAGVYHCTRGPFTASGLSTSSVNFIIAYNFKGKTLERKYDVVSYVTKGRSISGTVRKDIELFYTATSTKPQIIIAKWTKM